MLRSFRLREVPPFKVKMRNRIQSFPRFAALASLRIISKCGKAWPIVQPVFVLGRINAGDASAGLAENRLANLAEPG